MIKVAGALYLFYIAVQLWRANPVNEAEARGPTVGPFGLFRQEFFVAAGNPKAILVFTAFLPQFIDRALPARQQFAILGTIFLALEWIAIGAYAYVGRHMRRWFVEPRHKRHFNRGCAVLLGGAGLGLLLSKRA